MNESGKPELAKVAYKVIGEKWRALKYPDVKSWTVAGAEGSIASKIKSEERANLLAAAPDLLVELERALANLAAYAAIDDVNNPPDWFRSSHAGKYAAIKKAKGEK